MERLNAIFIEILGLSPDEINDKVAMKDVDLWDSLRHMMLITTIENTFQCKFSFEEIIKMQTIGDIKSILENKIKFKSDESD